MVEVELNAGDMFFLPAGWFHEVVSESVPAAAEEEGQEDGGGGGSTAYYRGHMAFNFWFHPPDTAAFDQPYSNSFWPDHWKKQQQQQQCA